MKRLRREFKIETPIVGVGVDRLDYTKGIPERLEALEPTAEAPTRPARSTHFHPDRCAVAVDDR